MYALLRGRPNYYYFSLNIYCLLSSKLQIEQFVGPSLSTEVHKLNQVSCLQELLHGNCQQEYMDKSIIKEEQNWMEKLGKIRI